MFQTSPHILTWSSDHNQYEIHSRGQIERSFRREDEAEWQTWLEGQTSFIFQDRLGRLNVYKETRLGEEGQWYVYHPTGKRYVGPTPNVTLARLEREIWGLLNTLSSAQTHSPSNQPESNEHVLASKLGHPRLPSALVARERLLKALDIAVEQKLTLISAAAGWGKTTLLTAWATQHSQQVGWVSLDTQDNDLAHFWINVITA